MKLFLVKPLSPTTVALCLTTTLNFNLSFFGVPKIFTEQVAFAAGDTPEGLLESYDKIMGPESFEAQVTMSTVREDGTNRAYEMRMLKSGTDKFRIQFLQPSVVAGQEILRVGENNWLYLPQLRRTSRIASRESFQGGDFNNADILRVNYREDYVARILDGQASAAAEAPSGATTGAPLGGTDGKEKSVVLELTAKTINSSYDKIHLWLKAKEGAPLKAKFFGSSGKLLRSAEYLNYKSLDGKVSRPTLVKMKNELLTARVSELSYTSFKTGVTFPAKKFVATDLGK